VLAILLLALISFNAWAYSLAVEEENKINECSSLICKGYYDSYYKDGVCLCYDLDDNGEYELITATYDW